MSTYPTPIIVIYPPEGVASDPASEISGLLQSMDSSDAADFDPSAYQIAIYAYVIEGMLYQASSALTACGTWSADINPGADYWAVLMLASTEPASPYDASQALAISAQLEAPSTLPTFDDIMAMPDDCFPQFLGSTMGAFQACAAYLNQAGSTEQELIALLTASDIDNMGNDVQSIAAKNNVSADDVSAVIAQLSDWQNAEQAVTNYFQGMVDDLTAEYVPQSSIITSVSDQIDTNLKNKTVHFDWWSFALNLFNLAMSVADPGIGSVLAAVLNEWSQKSSEDGGGGGGDQLNPTAQAVLNLVTGAIKLGMQYAVQNIPSGAKFDSSGMMELTVANLETQVSTNWQDGVNQLQKNWQNAQTQWRTLQWLSGCTWDTDTGKALVDVFLQQFTILVWSSLMPLKWHVVVDSPHSGWPKAGDPNYNAECLQNMDNDPTILFPAAVPPGDNLSNPLVYRFWLRDLDGEDSINPETCTTLWGTSGVGLGLNTVPKAVPQSYNRYEILTGPAEGQTSSNFSLASGLAVTWSEYDVGSHYDQLLVSSDGVTAPATARAIRPTVVQGDPILINISGFSGIRGWDPSLSENIGLVTAGGHPSGGFASLTTLSNTIGGQVSVSSAGLAPGSYDIYRAVYMKASNQLNYAELVQAAGVTITAA